MERIVPTKLFIEGDCEYNHFIQPTRRNDWWFVNVVSVKGLCHCQPYFGKGWSVNFAISQIWAWEIATGRKRPSR